MKEYRIRISASRTRNLYTYDDDNQKKFEMEFESKNTNGNEVPLNEVDAVINMMYEKLANLGKDVTLELESE